MILMGILGVTELLFVCGPMSYTVDNLWRTLLYLLLNNVFLVLGYRFYMSSLRSTCIKSVERSICSMSILKGIILVSVLCMPIRINVLWNINPFSLPAIVDHVISSVVDPGSVYHSKLEFKTDVWTYVNMFVNIFVYISLASGVYYWGKMGKGWKTIIAILVFLEIILPLGQGVRKGVLDIMLLVFFISVAAYPNLLIKKKRCVKLLLITCITCSLFLAYFIFSNMSRGSIDDINALVVNNSAFSSVKDVYKKISPLLIVTLCSVQSYACQGYYALALALPMPYKFCYFLGSSWFGINLSHRIGIEVFDKTYVARLEEFGVDSTINWHSIYTWLANDVSFVFVPLIMFLIGFFLAKTWNDTICNKSIFAPPIFFFFTVMVFYSFANNQVFSFMFIPFIITFVLWNVDRKRKICLK